MLLVLVGLSMGWLTFAPTALGGSASYVITEGRSMLPAFVANGLVITRTRDDYQVGEVVAYHNQQLHAVVMHRIIGRDGDRYVLQGDNNDFIDSYRPNHAEIVGQKWIYWPSGGKYFMFLRSPLNFAMIIGVITLLNLRPPHRSRRRTRHHS